jgi:Uma2 family endonuclease
MSFALSEIELPIRLRPDQPMTDAEFLRFCAANEPMRFERDANGEIIVMSPTGTEGGSVELDVAGELRNWALQDGRGKILGPNSGCRLPDGSIRAADAAWVSWPRWNSIDPLERKRYAKLCPEFVLEVRSESDRLTELQEKMQMWIANGVELAWLIDPIEKAVTIYRPIQEPEHLSHPASVQGTGPIAGFDLVMARIWE